MLISRTTIKKIETAYITLNRIQTSRENNFKEHSDHSMQGRGGHSTRKIKNKNMVVDLNTYSNNHGLSALIEKLICHIGFKTYNYVLFIRDIIFKI